MSVVSEILTRALKHHQAGDLASAANLYQRVLRIDAGHADALHLSGVLAHQNRQPITAIEHIQRAIKNQPHAAEYHGNLAAVYLAANRFAEAESSYREAIRLRPDFADAHYNLAIVLAKRGKPARAVESNRNCLEIDSEHISAINNLGIALKELNRLDEAAACHERAIRLEPHSAESYNNLGIVCQALRRLHRAAECFFQALTINPSYADALFNRSLLSLLRGDFSQGWRDFEYRWECELPSRDFGHPTWKGQDLSQSRILVYSEQGIGDEIMFASCISNVTRAAKRCVVECDPRLVALFQRSFPETTVVAKQDGSDAHSNIDFESCDYQIAIGSLPRFFRPNLESFPNSTSYENPCSVLARGSLVSKAETCSSRPRGSVIRCRNAYLKPDGQQVSKWRSRFKTMGNRLKVGISWRGGKKSDVELQRSTQLDSWGPLFTIPGVEFVNLQYGETTQELIDIQKRFEVEIHDWPDADPLKDLDNMAAEMAALDLVISVDNSTVHLAGAMGVPVWTLLPLASDWRWMLDRVDTPWYPGMRLFRQSSAGDWDELFSRVAAELKNHQAGDRKQAEANEQVRNVVATCSQSVAAHLQLGDAMFQSGRYVEAASSLRQAVHLEPNHPAAYKGLGNVLTKLGEVDAAKACLQRATKLDAGDVETHLALGVLCEQAGDRDAAIVHFRNALQLGPQCVQPHLNLGRIFLEQRQFDQARAHYSRAVAIDSQQTEAWCRLGLINNELGNLDIAIHCYHTALQHEPQLAETWYNLGNIFRDQNRLDEAETAYREAIKIRPEYAAAYNNLGTVLQKLERAEEAVGAYRAALAIDPVKSSAHANLGRAMHALGHFEDAITSLHRAAELEPDNAGMHYSLANVHKEKQDFESAIASYRRALEINPTNVTALYDLGNTYRACKNYDLANACYEKSLRVNPQDGPTLIALGNLLKTQDRLVKAASIYRRVLDAQPDQAVWRLWIASLCPSVFNAVEEIDEYRRQLDKDLREVALMGMKISLPQLSTAGCPPPYNLQFHGRDDLPIKKAFADLFSHSFQQAELGKRTGRPRVGFVVTDGHEGVFVRFMGKALERIDHGLFESTILCTRMGAKRIAKEMSLENIKTLLIPHRFEQIVGIIEQAEFDLLYHWEVGSDVNNYFLPFLRLAPVQCTSAGLPVTTGIPQMDDFLSWELAEPEDADAHYSERLIRTRTHLCFQTRMTMPDKPKTRAEFGFRDRQNIYVCAQKIPKFHPEFDEILARILRDDSNGLLVIPSDSGGYLAAKLQTRLSRVMPDVASRIMFLPRLNLSDYMSLLAVADVHLDPLHYGGGLSAYDVFAANKASVTLPTRFARGRYTFACYRKMEINDCIASTVDEYVDLAVRLAKEADYREHVEQQIRERSHLLFEEGDAVREYEELFVRLIEESRSA